MTPQSEKDCEFCPEHNVTDQRLTAAEDELTVVKKVIKENTEASNKQTTRLSLLITLMSIGTLSVLAGTIYTFTAIAQFKSDYAEHRIELINQMHTTQQETVKELGGKIDAVERTVDKRLDKMAEKLAALEVTVKQRD